MDCKFENTADRYGHAYIPSLVQCKYNYNKTADYNERNQNEHKRIRLGDKRLLSLTYQTKFYASKGLMKTKSVLNLERIIAVPNLGWGVLFAHYLRPLQPVCFGYDHLTKDGLS